MKHPSSYPSFTFVIYNRQYVLKYKYLANITLSDTYILNVTKIIFFLVNYYFFF